MGLDEERRAALERYHVLNTDPEPAFDGLTLLAAQLFNAPVALIALTNGDEQWCKSTYGLQGVTSVERSHSLRDLAFAQDGLLVIPDLRADPRTREHPLVIGPPRLRFATCAPLCTADGVKLGLLTVADPAPHPRPSDKVLQQMQVLAELVVIALEARAVDFARREALDKLELLQAAVSHANDAIYICRRSAEASRILYANDAFGRLLGYEPDELIGQATTLMRSEAVDAATVDEIVSSMRAGEANRYRVMTRRKDGQDIWVEAANAPIRTLPDGTTFTVSVMRDITEALREEHEARERSRLMALGESTAGMGHWRYDLTTGQMVWSAELYRLNGVTPDTYRPGRDALIRFIHPDDVARVGPLLGRRRPTRAIAKFTTRVVRADGEVRTMDARRVFEFNAAGEAVAVFGIMHDVTDRAVLQAELIEARDRAEMAAQAKAEFLANMSHELRTPLTSVIGFAGLLRDKPDLDPQSASYAARIDDASRSLLGVVNDVLDYSKLEAGGLELEQLPFDPLELVRSTTALLENLVSAKGVALAVEDADLPPWLLGDAGRLRQVLLNLVGNAAKFTQEGAITVSATYGADADGRPALMVAVRDTGIGIAPDMKERLFERFVQADGSITRRFGGTGLGLSITRKLVDLMKGEIAVDSQLGRGSTFTLSVPMPTASAPKAVVAAGVVTPDTIRVLLADDADSNRELVCAVLAAVGVEVDAVVNGVEAVEAVVLADYDLVLMDVQMPLMDGVEATRRIRALGGAMTTLPILALSANVLPEQTASYRSAGMDAHLGKPIDARALATAVMQWADSKRRGEAEKRLSA